MAPIENKNSLSVEMFKNRISKWEAIGSDCKLWQDYLDQVEMEVGGGHISGQILNDIF